MLCAQGVGARRGDDRRTTASLGLELVPGTGLLAACVPGAFGGWLAAARAVRDAGGSRDVLEFAIGYAERGYPGRAGHHGDDRARRAAASRRGPRRPSSISRRREPGSTFRNPQLARDLAAAARRGARRLARGEIERARRVYYEGFVAEEIDRFSRANGGLLDGRRPGARGAPTLEPPATVDYRGLTVCKTAAWGQGPAGLQQLRAARGLRRRRR